MSIKFKFAVPVLAMVLGAAAVPVFAQQDNGGGGAPAAGGGGGGGGGQNGGGGGGGGRGNPQQFMQRRLDDLKTKLGTTDDEFSAISPKISTVMTAQFDLRGRGRGGRGGPGGNQGGQGGGTQTELAKTLADLQTTLDQKDATAEDIKGKLDAVRAARKAAQESLVKAQEDLKSVLTARQEAVMVENGVLE